MDQKKRSTKRASASRESWRLQHKVHLLVDALGNGLRFLLTGGQRHDITQADALIGPRLTLTASLPTGATILDDFLQTIAASGATLWFLLEKAAFNHERMTTISIKNVT
ncbi:MAG: hypothetical protein R2867_28665 [Caldilineaceae bacterium]